MTEEELRQAKAHLEWLDTLTPEQFKARYEDLDLAEQIPRMLMYLDIGYLCGRIDLLERTLIKHQIELPR